MGKLPFVVEPRLKPIIERIGTEESGIIEIERRGYLTSGEKNFVQQILQQDKGTLRLIDLARKVSREKGYELQQAYELIVSTFTSTDRSNEAIEIEVEYSDAIQDAIKEITLSKSREDLVMAACLITHRIDDTFEIQDIMDIHPDIVSGIAQLYRDEEAKSIERLQAADKAVNDSSVVGVEQIEKKRRVAKTN
jgi:hypothetical protein